MRRCETLVQCQRSGSSAKNFHNASRLGDFIHRLDFGAHGSRVFRSGQGSLLLDRHFTGFKVESPTLLNLKSSCRVDFASTAVMLCLSDCEYGDFTFLVKRSHDYLACLQNDRTFIKDAAEVGSRAGPMCVTQATTWHCGARQRDTAKPCMGLREHLRI